MRSLTGARPPHEVDRGQLSALGSMMERLIGVLDQETEAVEASRAGELRELQRRKMHGLLEMERLLLSQPRDIAAPSVRESAERLRRSLARNCATLQRHMRAMREVVGTLTRMARDAESDGTYSPAGRKRG